MIYLDRFKTGPDGTFGKLTDDCEFISSPVYTVERPETGDHPCIPEGVYSVVPYDSPTKGKVWLLKDVPGRTMIEIHPANWARELKGCIAPGDAIGKPNGVPGVLNSQDTFERLKDELPQRFQLTIRSEYGN